MINASGVSPDPAKLRVLATWPVPTDVRALQAFLGFVNFYGDFIRIRRISAIPFTSSPLAAKARIQYQLDEADLDAFNELKRRLCTQPHLAHPDLTKPFIVHTDASKFAIGAVLLQRSDSGVERPISFFSKKLSSPQQNYSTYERECLAVVAALEHFRVYLLGHPFRLRTDHKALKWLFSKEPKASPRVSGWIATLMEYPVVIEYICGTENTIADILSRLSGHAVDDVVHPALASWHSFLHRAQSPTRIVSSFGTHWYASNVLTRQSLALFNFYEMARSPAPTDLDVDPLLKLYSDVWSQLVVENDLLQHCNERKISTRVVVPPTLRE